ncbi:MAG: hypothetical protein CMI15_13900, partial [Opitutaceae bacterium]|nr:hypothetical protein [Opitutaceae bacterium]
VKEPEHRQEKIELAARLLAKEPVLLGEEMIASVGDPFKTEEKPEVVAEEVVEVAEKEIPAAELIPLLAENVNPTGIFSIGGDCYLMFKEDKVKSGEIVPVVYNKKKYMLEITNVLRNGYNLRFQDAELEIKLK